MRMICPLVAKERHIADSWWISLLRLGSGKKGKEEGVGVAKEGALRGLLRPMLLPKETLPPPCFYSFTFSPQPSAS